MYNVSVNTQHNFKIDRVKTGWEVDGKVISPDILKVEDGVFHIILNDISYSAELVEAQQQEKSFTIKVNNQLHQITVKDDFDLLLEKLGMNSNNKAKLSQLKAPMPGLILDIPVQEGDEIKKGTPLIILEAMKMENVIKSPGEGKIKSIVVKQGNSVEKNQVLIQF